MTYRRDLLNIRVDVRSASGPDSALDVFAHRLGDGPSSPGRSGPEPRLQGARTPLTAEAAARGALGVVLVKAGLRQVAVRVNDVTFVEAARNYVRIHLEGGAVVKSRVPITRLASHFGSDRFLRVHRGRLVNADRVRSVRALTGGRLSLTLNDGSMVLVARDRRRVVLAELGRSAAAH